MFLTLAIISKSIVNRKKSGTEAVRGTIGNLLSSRFSLCRGQSGAHLTSSSSVFLLTMVKGNVLFT